MPLDHQKHTNFTRAKTMECIIIIAIIVLREKAIGGNSEKEESEKEANEQQARQKITY